MPTAILPYPPSVNRLYATIGRRRVLTQEGKQYIKQVGECLLLQWRHWMPMQETLALTITVQFPVLSRKRDLDNLLKILQDSLTKHLVYADDSQIRSLHIHAVGLPWEHGRIRVTLEPYTMEDLWPDDRL